MLNIDEHGARGTASDDVRGHKERAALIKITPSHSKGQYSISLGDFPLSRGQCSNMLMHLALNAWVQFPAWLLQCF